MSTNPLREPVEFLRSLYRDSENGWILGVCAGLADHFRVNVAGVRLIALVLAWFVTLPAVIIYAVLALLMRDRPLIYRGGNDERHFWSCRSAGGAERDPSGRS